DKVAQLKAQIQAGTYSVSPDDFASKLLEKYNNILG
ncbi:MAG: flagellar biosynthesis anti-sigma factor FlgM, partial [Agathobacter sp.]